MEFIGKAIVLQGALRMRQKFVCAVGARVSFGKGVGGVLEVA